MWPVLTFLLDVLSWIVDAIGFGYTFAVLIIWSIQRFGTGPADRMHRATITTNTLLLVVGIVSCIDRSFHNDLFIAPKGGRLTFPGYESVAE